MGKFIGFILGFMVFGPFGAFIGLLIGHFMFDAKSTSSFYFQRTSSAEAQQIFFDNLFGMLAKLAKADGTVSQEEVHAIDQIMINQLRLDPLSRKRAIDIFQRAKQSPLTFDHYAGNMANTFRGNYQILQTVLAILFAVASADGRISPEEDALLKSASRIFGIADNTYGYTRSSFSQEQPLGKYYSILQSSESDSDETIKANYRRLVKEYHPDKIQSKGLPPEFQSFAKEKFQEIQQAYEEIRKRRNL